MDAQWKSSLTASERYENIQLICAGLEASDPANPAMTSQQKAITIETLAYQNSATKDEYDRACASPLQDSRPQTDETAPCTGHNRQDSGVKIGAYEACHPVADGVTSVVFRSGDKALKVIVETSRIEPHNPFREAKILKSLKRHCVPLIETFRDQEQRFVLVFPYMPLSLGHLIDKAALTPALVRHLFRGLFEALCYIHSQDIIHRDVKPSALLLASPDGPALLSDFGTAWHPQLSRADEPSDAKILDIGTGPYRAPECLFGNRSYGPPVDMWSAGAMLAECCRDPPSPLFQSRPAHEDGNQLGLILSIFKTLGTPTRETWPEAAHFKTPPFDMYQVFKARPPGEILAGIDPGVQLLIASLLIYDTRIRASAQKALSSHYMTSIT